MNVAGKVMDNPPSAAESEVSSASPSPSYFYRLLEEDTTVMRIAEPYMAPLGQNIRQWTLQGKEAWVEMATGDDHHDRIFAVTLGYAVVGLLLAVYLNVLTVGTMRSAGRAVRSAIRQQLLVVKVCDLMSSVVHHTHAVQRSLLSLLSSSSYSLLGVA